jgi:hypothetical protein
LQMLQAFMQLQSLFQPGLANAAAAAAGQHGLSPSVMQGQVRNLISTSHIYFLNTNLKHLCSLIKLHVA